MTLLNYSGCPAGPADAGPPPLDAAVPNADLGTAASPVTHCVGEEQGDHLQLVSTYAASWVYGDHLAELAPAIPSGHVEVARLVEPLPEGVDVIVDLHWELFDYTQRTAHPDINARLDVVAAAANPVLHRVRAFYLIDEPYLAGHEIPRSELEIVIDAVNAKFPGVPTYITFAHHCFDPLFGSSVCVVPAAHRGIPDGLDWVGFDWYNESNVLSQAAQHVASRVAPGVARIKELAPSAHPVIVPEAYTNGSRQAETVLATLHDYFALAVGNPSVFGVDFFLWADVPPPENFRGAQSLPAIRAAVRSFGRSVSQDCGTTSDLVPVTEWYSASGPDYRYEPWVWDGRSAGYRVEGVAFALAPEEAAGTVPLYHCLIERPDSVDSYLTVDSGCDGVPHRGDSAPIGGIFPTQQPGTVELHRFVTRGFARDHGYAVRATEALPEGYRFETAVGWVYPPSAL